MFKNKKILNNQRGDTLVSVALSIVALGVTMTIAYVVISRSFDQGQQARERQQVVQQVQAQTEILKSQVLHSKASGNIDGCSRGLFLECIKAGDLNSQRFCFETYEVSNDIRIRLISPASSNYDKCYVSNDIYYEDLKIDIEYIKNKDGNPNSGDEHLYIIRARWNDDEDNLQSQIRLDPELANLDAAEIRPITP